MKKLVLMLGFMLAATALFAQKKPDRTKELRDSIFTVMKLSDENKQKMHESIDYFGKTIKTINKDATLTDEQKKEKITALKAERIAKDKEMMTKEQMAIWKQFGADQQAKRKAAAAQ